MPQSRTPVVGSSVVQVTVKEVEVVEYVIEVI